MAWSKEKLIKCFKSHTADLWLNALSEDFSFIFAFFFLGLTKLKMAAINLIFDLIFFLSFLFSFDNNLVMCGWSVLLIFDSLKLIEHQTGIISLNPFNTQEQTFNKLLLIYISSNMQYGMKVNYSDSYWIKS